MHLGWVCLTGHFLVLRQVGFQLAPLSLFYCYRDSFTVRFRPKEIGQSCSNSKIPHFQNIRVRVFVGPWLHGPWCPHLLDMARFFVPVSTTWHVYGGKPCVSFLESASSSDPFLPPRNSNFVNEEDDSILAERRDRTVSLWSPFLHHGMLFTQLWWKWTN